MSNPTEPHADLVELQTRLAFIEDTMRALDERVAAQQRQLEQVEVWCKTLARRMREASDPTSGDGGFEVPPHY